MRIASVADVKARFSAYLKESENGPVIVTRNGRPIAVLLGIQDEDEIERLLLARSPWFLAILEKSRQQIRNGEWLSAEDFWRELDAEYTETPKSEHGQVQEARYPMMIVHPRLSERLRDSAHSVGSRSTPGGMHTSNSPPKTRSQ